MPRTLRANTWSAGIMLALCGAGAAPALAEVPTPFLQDSTIIGTAGTLTATRVPVQKANGAILYQDITIQFKTSPAGKLSLAPGFPKFALSPPIITSGFLAGNYAGPATLGNGKFLITVTGPGHGQGGETTWSLGTTKGANACTLPLTATWYTGPAAGNPLAARLKKDGITFTGYSYGIVGASVSSSCFGSLAASFLQNALIGVSQTGESLTIVSFTPNGDPNADSKTPIATIPYTLLP